MKKLLFLFVMLVPLIILSQTQPAASTLGIEKIKKIDAPSGNRSIPPGFLVWSQLPDCEGNVYASQLAPAYPFDAKMADDFLFPASPGPITAVRWWTGFWNGTYVAPASFNILIYDDLSCLPGNLVTSWNIPFAVANEDAGCSPFYESREYWGSLVPAFNPLPGQHYWIVIQPVLDFPPQSGIFASIAQNLCFAAQYFDLLGGPVWYTVSPPVDMAFELYTSSAPPLETPVSPWVFLLAGVLIASSVLFRYRRIL
jgi:hypothetical protein